MHISEGRIVECVANVRTICIAVLEGKFWCGSEAKIDIFEFDDAGASMIGDQCGRSQMMYFAIIDHAVCEYVMVLFLRRFLPLRLCKTKFCFCFSLSFFSDDDLRLSDPALNPQDGRSAITTTTSRDTLG